MKTTLRQGQLIEVELDDFAGQAGFMERPDGRAAVSFLPNRRGYSRVGAEVTIDGRAWRIASVLPSDYIPGYRTVELRAIVTPKG